MKRNKITKLKNLFLSSLIALTLNTTACSTIASKLNIRKLYKPVSIKDIKNTNSPIKKPRKNYTNYDSLNLEEVIKNIQTPQEAQNYINNYIKYDYSQFNINKNKKTKKYRVSSFRHTYKNGKGICIDKAIAAAAVLKDNGYEPLLLLMKKGLGGHVVFLYKENNKFGAVNPDKRLRPPVYESINALVKNLGRYESYGIINIEQFNPNWIKTDKNLNGYELFKFEYGKFTMPHKVN